MASLCFVVVLAHVLLMDTGLCVPVDAELGGYNVGLQKDVSFNQDSLKKAFELAQSLDSMLKEQNAKRAAEVELDDQASHQQNVSLGHQEQSNDQLNNSLSQQEQRYSMSNVQKQSYNMSSSQLNVLEQQSYNMSNVQQNVTNQQQSYMSYVQQSEILPPSGNLSSSYHDDKMDDVGSPDAEFVVNV
ncbi:uncharacterized protein LOC144005066 [Festucalex cinctus]